MTKTSTYNNKLDYDDYLNFKRRPIIRQITNKTLFLLEATITVPFIIIQSSNIKFHLVINNYSAASQMWSTKLSQRTTTCLECKLNPPLLNSAKGATATAASSLVIWKELLFIFIVDPPETYFVSFGVYANGDVRNTNGWFGGITPLDARHFWCRRGRCKEKSKRWC